MKNIKKIITGMMLVLALTAFTACGERTDNNADETNTAKDNVMDNGDRDNNMDNEDAVPDADRTDDNRTDTNLDALQKRADQNMYENKKQLKTFSYR